MNDLLAVTTARWNDVFMGTMSQDDQITAGHRMAKNEMFGLIEYAKEQKHKFEVASIFLAALIQKLGGSVELNKQEVDAWGSMIRAMAHHAFATAIEYEEVGDGKIRLLLKYGSSFDGSTTDRNQHLSKVME